MSEELATTADKEISGAADQSSAKTLTTVVYALQAAALLVGITFIVAVVINYVKRAEVEGTPFASHFRWQIRTFWFSFLWSFVGIVTAFFMVGYFVLLANMVWVIYRIVKGWLALNEGKEMYQ